MSHADEFRRAREAAREQAAADRARQERDRADAERYRTEVRHAVWWCACNLHSFTVEDVEQRLDAQGIRPRQDRVILVTVAKAIIARAIIDTGHTRRVGRDDLPIYRKVEPNA